MKRLRSLPWRLFSVLVFGCTACTIPIHALRWFPLGPYGGDARSFAADPNNSKHLYLGTANGWVYDSQDGGVTWRRLGEVGNRSDLIIDHILTDARNPQRLVVGAWIVDHPDGGLFISEDGGKTWWSDPEMRGQSIRSLTRSSFDPEMMVAGTLQGVFRSMDDGLHWTQISPIDSKEIHEVQSVAIDPRNPQVIYAGTWHLPWKTVDGGQHWESIKHGIIDDSDVFSILIDPNLPQVVYASACSGIYKSLDAGILFHKVQGIPSEARRTRKLEQDPEHLDTVYAGTTEGLYRTLDGGKDWQRLTAPDLVVNDVYVDPHDSGHVLLATERGGVLRSEDFAASFVASNSGFSSRQVMAYAADPMHPATVYAGVVNDKQDGGVFQSIDGGAHWREDSVGLDGRDIYSLAMTPAGTLLAGTPHGIFRSQDDVWVNSGRWLRQTGHGRRSTGLEEVDALRAERLSSKQPMIDAVVYALVSGRSLISYAGTSEGLLKSDDDGIAWTPVTSLPLDDVRFVAVEKNQLLAAGLRQMYFSADGGAQWKTIGLPSTLSQISAVAIDGNNDLWVGGREGVFYSTDDGLKWKIVYSLDTPQVDGLYFDRQENRILLTTATSSMVFAVQLPGFTVRYWDTGWKLRFARPIGDHLLAGTLYNGVVIQPKMVKSDFSDRYVSFGSAASAGSSKNQSRSGETAFGGH
ncbi:MAG: WD40/YVTN/BNR-like repeat-containing protein [Acidobacteriota bacterium]